MRRTRKEPNLYFDKAVYGVGEEIDIFASGEGRTKKLPVKLFVDTIYSKWIKLDQISKNSDTYSRRFKLVPLKDKKNTANLLSKGILPVLKGQDLKVMLPYRKRSFVAQALIVDIMPEMILDRDDYSPFDEMIISIISPDNNLDPDTIEKIKVKISSSSSKVRAFVFEETGPNTGIFEHAIRLSPDLKQFRGDLLAKRDDVVRIEYQKDADTTAFKEVQIKYHLATAEFDRDSYQPNMPAFLTIIDPDENRVPDAPDTFYVQVTSHADPVGNRIEMVETGERTGTFVGQIDLSLTGEGLAALKVSPPDTIIVKHVDRTLPSPVKLAVDQVETEEHKEIFLKAPVLPAETAKIDTRQIFVPHKRFHPKKVFIVHGHDDTPRKMLATLLSSVDLEPIVLHEQPNKGRTIMEKLEDNTSDVGYAFVLLTPDDIGRAAKFGHARMRARQNVIFELGYMIGKLGRNRVCCLHPADIELPSDMHGVLYLEYKRSVKECSSDILRELKSAGYSVQTQ